MRASSLHSFFPYDKLFPGIVTISLQLLSMIHLRRLCVHSVAVPSVIWAI